MAEGGGIRDDREGGWRVDDTPDVVAGRGGCSDAPECTVFVGICAILDVDVAAAVVVIVVGAAAAVVVGAAGAVAVVVVVIAGVLVVLLGGGRLEEDLGGRRQLRGDLRGAGRISGLGVFSGRGGKTSEAGGEGGTI